MSHGGPPGAGPHGANSPHGQPVEHGREPCPDRIVDDIGGAFGMGACGGAVWHTFRGFINSPKNHKIVGAIEAVRRESPKLGGSFAIWGALFACFDCSCSYIRRKEDPFNAIAAGFLTGGFLQLRSGLRPAFRSAVFGGVLLAMIEGLGIALQKMTAKPPPGSPFPQGMPADMQPGTSGMPGYPGGPMGAPAGAGGPMPGPSGFEQQPSSEGTQSSGGVFSWFGFGEKPKGPSSQQFEHDDFTAPPPMPDFKADDFKSYK